jgi:archaeal type IV pilus assembly protein PilA
MQKNSESAVSPVVAIMLMLVVTIIIAAIVSGFAGGLVQGNNQAPQATIKGMLSVNVSSNVLIMNHMGGDELATEKTDLVLKESADYGSYAGLLGSGPELVVNKTKIHDVSGKFWVNATDGGKDVLVWRPGEPMYYELGSKTFTSSDVGKSLELEVNTQEGKSISRSKVPIVT